MANMIERAPAIAAAPGFLRVACRLIDWTIPRTSVVSRKALSSKYVHSGSLAGSQWADTAGVREDLPTESQAGCAPG